MLVLSSIYQLEDQGYLVDYPLLSSKLSLSQSSIRDYIQRIINKGFSLSKEKVNNKQIILHIAISQIAIKTVKSQSQRIIWLSFITVGTILMGFTMSRIDLILPSIFPEPASYPYLDALTTIMSFAAQILMAHRYIESWALWILVDIIGIWLYYAKGVVFVSLLYFIFLILAIKGLLNWMNN